MGTQIGWILGGYIIPVKMRYHCRQYPSIMGLRDLETFNDVMRNGLVEGPQSIETPKYHSNVKSTSDVVTTSCSRNNAHMQTLLGEVMEEAKKTGDAVRGKAC